MDESIASKLSRYTGDEVAVLELEPDEMAPQEEQGDTTTENLSSATAYTGRCTHGACALFYVAVLLGWVLWYPLAVLLPLLSIVLISNGNHCPLADLHMHVFGGSGCSSEVEAEHYVLINMCQLSAIVYAITMCMGWEP